MNIAYGSAVQNAFKAILYYEIEETDTTYKVTFKRGGASPYSSRYIAIAENRTITEQAVLNFNGRKIYDNTVSHAVYSQGVPSFEANTTYTVGGVTYYGSFAIGTTQTISKTAEEQTLQIEFTDTLSSFCRYDSSTGSRSSYFGQSTSTLTMTLTVPALAKPTVTATARRDDTVDTTVLFEIAVKSFRNDSISTIKVLINGELTEVNGGSIGSSLVINRSASVEGNSQGPLTCSVIAVGRGGESAEYPITIPSSFFTMDIGGKGKSIAFGEPAPDTDLPDNGKFVCAMDADFKGKLNGYPAKHIGASVHLRGNGKTTALALSSSAGGTYPLDGSRYEINTYGTTANYEEVFDVDAHGRITTKEPGIYLVNAHFYFTTGFTVNDILHGFVGINTSANLGWNEIIYKTPSATPYHGVGLSFVYPLPENIQLALRMHNQTGARGYTNVNGNISLMVTKIGNIDGDLDVLAYV